MGRPIRPAPRRGVTLQRPPQPEHRLPLPLHPAPGALIGDVDQADHRYRPAVCEVGALDLPRRRGAPNTSSSLAADIVSVGAAAMEAMTPHTTDTEPLPPLPNLAAHLINRAPVELRARTAHPPDPTGSRQPSRSCHCLLLILTHLRINPTTWALAAPLRTSQSVNPIIHHVVMQANTRRPDTNCPGQSWIIDAP